MASSQDLIQKAPYDDIYLVPKTVLLSLTPLIRIHYVSALPPESLPTSTVSAIRGTILLIHGFPQTSYQYRYVIGPLARAGYHIVCPDIRGAGASSHPPSGYTKNQLAGDLFEILFTHERVRGKVHVVGQDIGGMIAHAFATGYPEHTASVAIGECPLPGTTAFEASKNSALMYHFSFQNVPDLPETLVTGKERVYLKHFYYRAAYNPSAITEEDVDVYAAAYTQPGGLRCGFELYRAFEEDVKYNKDIVQKKGKCKVPVLALFGEYSFCKDYCKEMLQEVYQGPVQVCVVKNAGHWTTEENPVGFVDGLLKFFPEAVPRAKL